MLPWNVLNCMRHDLHCNESSTYLATGVRKPCFTARCTAKAIAVRKVAPQLHVEMRVMCRTRFGESPMERSLALSESQAGLIMHLARLGALLQSWNHDSVSKRYSSPMRAIQSRFLMRAEVQDLESFHASARSASKAKGARLTNLTDSRRRSKRIKLYGVLNL